MEEQILKKKEQLICPSCGLKAIRVTKKQKVCIRCGYRENLK